MIDGGELARILVLLGIANGTPIFAKKLLGDHFSMPLDGGLSLSDGKPLFGASKTIRGVVVSLCCAALVSPLLGFDWILGASFAAASLAGDLVSSFVKRRLGMHVHAQAFGLDQIPESLLPLLLFRHRLDVSALEIAITVSVFVMLEIALSRLLFKLGIRDRPY